MYYLAVDIGASSGRHILGSIVNGKITLEEVHRFENSIKNKNGKKVWDVKYLFNEIKEGIKKCKEINKIPHSMGIDTWAVDFVLLDEDDKIIGDSVAYRDSRTDGIKEEVYKIISKSDLYDITGIQEQNFNTIFQLKYLKDNTDEIEKASSFLMLPDYFNFLLTGNKKQEYTNATSTALVNAKAKKWDKTLIEKLGFKSKLFTELCVAGTIVGDFSKKIQEEVGFNCKVVLPCTHDTASAIVSLPDYKGEGIYISSGTWSLMGIESNEPIISRDSEKYNYTNEGGIDYRFRFLKNIMGLWIIQNVRKELSDITFATLCNEAEKSTIRSTIDCNDDVFFAPKSMIDTIQTYCENTNQEVPTKVGDIAAVVYNSLALSYGEAAKEIEKISGKTFDSIYIIGGGSNADYLNELTAKYTGKTVYAKPSEATAIGNLAVQMMANKEYKDLYEVRKAIYKSFEIDIIK